MTDASTWLVQEVTDLLGTSSVGLYEFVWILRGQYPDAGEGEIRSWASNALGRLLQESDVRLVLLQWPSEEEIDPGGRIQDLSSVDWADPSRGKPYLAIRRD